ncbi:hypothetical protein [Streptomyces sp. TLI_105]|uniref:hypothetical protein n=1 Tax=Streptomyces sp. TLI_105 TaxID=1881019 RepID=UPI000895EBDC|nr:hypothetical protein [Streptomyces sp. TLI_105]SEC64470.1 hypothetical protein SAMN05428939_2890 [Streptomyces sp. TLI_105]
MRTALRTAIATALVAGVAITAPALAAGAAFAADGPTAVSPVTDAKSAAQPSAEPSAEAPADPAAGPAAGTPAKPGTEPTAKPEAKPSAKPSEEAPAPATRGPKPGPAVMLGPCTAEWVIAAAGPYDMTLTLTHDAKKGPKAVLKDANGTVIATVDRDHPDNARYGLTIQDAHSRYPGLGDRPQGGVPYTWHAFTRLPVECFDASVPASVPELTGPVKTGECTVREVIAADFGRRWRIVLTNDLKKGPTAVMIDPDGQVMDAVDRDRPGLSPFGLRIKGADTLTPLLGQRVQSVETPKERWSDFPKLPKGCGEKGTPAGNGNIAATNTGQTSVIPQGGVAAGAEFATEDDSTALIAVGAGAASLAAAGLGFVVLRRRAAGARG